MRSVEPLVVLDDARRSALECRLGQVLIAAREGSGRPARNSNPELAVAHSLRRIVQRGPEPPVDPVIEEILLLRAGLSESKVKSADDTRTARPRSPEELPGADDILAAAIWAGDGFDGATDHASERAEIDRFRKWVLARCGVEVARWLVPAARLGALGDPVPDLEADFLFCPPWRDPMALRIARPTGAFGAVPAAPNPRVEAVGAGDPAEIERVVIPQKEAMELQGPTLEKLVSRLTPPVVAGASDAALALVYGPTLGVWLTLALAEALERGWLSGEVWRLEVIDPLDLAAEVLPAVLEAVTALSVVHGRNAAPDRCELATGDDLVFAFEREGPAGYRRAAGPAGRVRAELEVHLDLDRSLIEALPEGGRVPRIVARASAVPARAPGRTSADVAPTGEDGRSGSAAATPVFELEAALERLLLHAFAKPSFRAGQFATLARLLAGENTVLRLPPGGGKSQVYLLFGLISDGDTLVVEPGRSRVEVQLEYLRRHGFDEPEVLLEEDIPASAEASMDAPGGRFVFVTADRMAQTWCRERLALRIANGPPVGLVVLEDAHCLSEWGHDFRPWLYVLGASLERTLAEAGHERAPVLALTGSMDREVLHDVVNQLGDPLDAGILVAPEVTPRPEGGLELVKPSPEGASEALVDFLRRLPARLGEARERFFARPVDGGYSGVVLCAEEDDARRVAKALRSFVPETLIGVLCGEPARASDVAEHRRNLLRDLESYLAGELAVLVVVEGMARWLELPWVRYMILYGLPSSIEAYREEEGRSGHGSAKVLRALIYGSGNESDLRSVLDPDVEETVARSRFAAWRGNRRRGGIQAPLERHFASLPGAEVESAHLRTTLEAMKWDSLEGKATRNADDQNIRIPSGESSPATELALYRLARLGVLRTFHYDSARDEIEIVPMAMSRSERRRALLDWVDQLDPGGRAGIERRLAGSKPRSAVDEVISLAEAVLEVVYRRVEPARRGALGSVWRWTRRGAGSLDVGDPSTDPGAEAMGARLQPLLAASSFEPNDWISVLGGVLPGDAGELIQEIDKGLESHPGHPGMLLARSLGRLLTGEDRAGFSRDLDDLLMVSTGIHGVSWENVAVMAAWLARRTRKLAPPWAVEVWLGWEAAGGPAHLLREEEMGSMRDPGQSAGESVVVLARRLTEAGAVANSLAEHFQVEGSEL